jgi:hypothetical protein
MRGTSSYANHRFEMRQLSAHILVAGAKEAPEIHDFGKFRKGIASAMS